METTATDITTLQGFGAAALAIFLMFCLILLKRISEFVIRGFDKVSNFAITYFDVWSEIRKQELEETRKARQALEVQVAVEEGVHLAEKAAKEVKKDTSTPDLSPAEKKQIAVGYVMKSVDSADMDAATLSAKIDANVEKLKSNENTIIEVPPPNEITIKDPIPEI